MLQLQPTFLIKAVRILSPHIAGHFQALTAPAAGSGFGLLHQPGANAPPPEAGVGYQLQISATQPA